MSRTIRDGLAAGAVAAVLSGAPSTAVALVRGGDVLEASAAAGTLLLPTHSWPQCITGRPRTAAARRNDDRSSMLQHRRTDDPSRWEATDSSAGPSMSPVTSASTSSLGITRRTRTANRNEYGNGAFTTQR